MQQMRTKDLLQDQLNDIFCQDFICKGYFLTKKKKAEYLNLVFQFSRLQTFWFKKIKNTGFSEKTYNNGFEQMQECFFLVFLCVCLLYSVLQFNDCGFLCEQTLLILLTILYLIQVFLLFLQLQNDVHSSPRLAFFSFKMVVIFVNITQWLLRPFLIVKHCSAIPVI